MWLQQMLILEITATDSDLDSQTATGRSKRRPLKSGKLHTADSMVLHKVTWPYKLVYKIHRQPAMYNELSINLFVSRYLTVMEAEKLMMDAERYGWEPVRAFYAVWLQQMENG